VKGEKLQNAVIMDSSDVLEAIALFLQKKHGVTLAEGKLKARLLVDDTVAKEARSSVDHVATQMDTSFFVVHWDKK
jgi:hypothetical protein